MSGSKSSGEVRTLRVNALARVEGEGALHVTIRDGRVEDVRLEIFEPPRFFEAFLRGRDFHEVPDITARICGICPIAYQMSACHALEKAVGIVGELDPWIRSMRDLLYCGEWIASHVLHIFMLHLPDFLGYESVVTLAADHREIVERALRIKRLGNDLVVALAGRSVHPVGVRVGGFYSAMTAERAAGLARECDAAVKDMCELTMFLAEKVTYPDFDREYEFVSMSPAGGYPMNFGPIVSSKGLKIEAEEYRDYFEETQVPHSTAFHSTIKGRGAYLVGPLARLNLCSDRLHPAAAGLLRDVCRAVKRALPWNNSYLSLPARAVETVHALALSADILRGYKKPQRSYVESPARAGTGAHATEAPRGLLWHRYTVDGAGAVVKAEIVPPTSQNQMQIESDLRAVAATITNVGDDEAYLKCEHVVRNYDPCISCSVHFLKIKRTWLDGRGKD